MRTIRVIVTQYPRTRWNAEDAYPANPEPPLLVREVEITDEAYEAWRQTGYLPDEVGTPHG